MLLPDIAVVVLILLTYLVSNITKIPGSYSFQLLLLYIVTKSDSFYDKSNSRNIWLVVMLSSNLVSMVPIIALFGHKN